MKIKSEPISQPDIYNQPLFHKILSKENSLQTYESLSEFHSSFKTMKNLNISVNLQSLSLKLLNIIYLFDLLDCTSNLRYCNIILLCVLIPKNESNVKRDLPSIKLRKLSLTVLANGIGQQVFHFLTSLIK